MSGYAIHIHPCIVQFDQSFCNGEAEARAAVFTRCIGFCLLKRFKDRVYFICSNANTRITYRKPYFYVPLRLFYYIEADSYAAFSVNLMAFPTRFNNTWQSRALSPITIFGMLHQ